MGAALSCLQGTAAVFGRQQDRPVPGPTIGTKREQQQREELNILNESSWRSKQFASAQNHEGVGPSATVPSPRARPSVDINQFFLNDAGSKTLAVGGQETACALGTGVHGLLNTAWSRISLLESSNNDTLPDIVEVQSLLNPASSQVLQGGMAWTSPEVGRDKACSLTVSLLLNTAVPIAGRVQVQQAQGAKLASLRCRALLRRGPGPTSGVACLVSRSRFRGVARGAMSGTCLCRGACLHEGRFVCPAGNVVPFARWRRHRATHAMPYPMPCLCSPREG